MNDYVATIAETTDGFCVTGHAWQIRLCRDDLSGEHVIAIRHRRRDGSRTTTIFPARDRGNRKALIAALRAQDARVPLDDRGADFFAAELIRKVPARAVISTRRPAGATGRAASSRPRDASARLGGGTFGTTRASAASASPPGRSTPTGAACLCSGRSRLLS